MTPLKAKLTVILHEEDRAFPFAGQGSGAKIIHFSEKYEKTVKKFKFFSNYQFKTAEVKKSSKK